MKNYNIEQYKEKESQGHFEREEAYLRAKKKVEKIMGFYWHLASYIIVNAFIIIMIARHSGEDFWSFGTFSTAFFWGIGLAFHALGVFGKNFLFKKEWEERKIAEYMEKERKRWE